MPPAPGVKITQAELDERVRLGIDVVQRPLRSAGTRGIVNRPGDVTPLVVGTIPFPVVAIKYPDFANTYSVAEFQNMLFGTWFSGSARDYYHEVSYNQFHMSGTVVGWYTAANNKAYYGYSNGWTRAAMLVKEAAAASDSAVDYSIYDIDGDGYVDAFTCIHAGYGTEESGSGSDIWSHAWSFSDAGIGAYTTNDPRPGYPGQYIKIDDYTTDPERSNRSNYGTMVSIGVYCHEWGHALGLPDLYDTDGGGEGLGNWTLMAGGSWGGNGNSPYYPVHLDPWSKMELGWLCPTAVRSRNLYSIPNIENSARAYWLMARERTFKEYFLVENRRKTRFDTLLYNSGLLIYHVDDSVIARRRGSNAVNNGGSGWKYGVALEQADGQDHLFNGTNRGDANDPWPGGLGRTTFDSTSTTPNSRTNYPSSATLITGCLVKNIPASAPTVQCTLGSGLVGAFTGGPDSRGYSWIDSDTAGGPHYNWVDITSTGTLLGNGDDARWSISLPYTFRYYNTNYNTVWISTNGWLSFGSDPGTNAPTNTAIPASAAPNRAVYVFWDDLNLVSSDSGYVYYQHGGTSPNCSTVIMWKNARVKGSVTYNQATFAAVLYEGGRIVLRYRDAAVTDTSYTWGRSATVGIEDENGTVGLQYIYNGTPKGNLLANERAIQFAQSGATVRDVGTTTVVAPAGTIDSGTTVTPSCTVYNYGTTTESYSVRCRVGSFYNQTASVTNHAPGVKLYVTFPAYSTWPRGTFSVTCSTELGADATPSNDKATGSVTVRVLDAQALAITAPTGTVDSGSVVVPQASVRNNGTAAATFNVRFEIQGGYSNTQTVTNLASGATTTVTFANWTATQRGALATRCTTMLAGDVVPANNLVTGSVTVRVQDVGATRVIAPAGTIDSGTVVTPACSVYNYGSTTESYNVRCKVSSFYNQTANVTNHTSGTRVYVTFPSWTALQRGTHLVSCSTELTGDAVQANDKASGSVTVRVADVGCQTLLAPSGTVDSGSSFTPACTVYNYGSASATYTVRMKIGVGYNQTTTVANHAAGTALYLTFPVWTAGLPRGSYAVSCSTELTGDMNNANDKRTGSVAVGVTDAATVALLAPSGTVDSGTAVTPACTVANYGTSAASFSVRMKVGSTYNQTAAVTNLTPGAKAYVTFAGWTATMRGSSAVTCSTELTGDLVQTNNKLTGSVTVRVRDVGCATLVSPVGAIDSGTVITPACTVVNHGTSAESYTVRMRIGTGYDRTASVSSHAPGARVYITFPTWNAGPRGPIAVSCSTQLSSDMQPTNDRQTGQVDVVVRDVACTQLLAPSGVVDSGMVITPACSMRNLGTASESYTVRMRIGAGYNQTATIANHAPG
ncbi:MAG: M6 family metalloprotease domain-containing protein, partial [candidate division WOR-3 bacterium]